jgi:hypothetical protein
MKIMSRKMENVIDLLFLGDGITIEATKKGALTYQHDILLLLKSNKIGCSVIDDGSEGQSFQGDPAGSGLNMPYCSAQLQFDSETDFNRAWQIIQSSNLGDEGPSNAILPTLREYRISVK